MSGGYGRETRTRPPVQPQHELAKLVQTHLGSTSDQVLATDRMREVAKIAHLITPTRVCPVIPEGTAVSLSMVLIDKEWQTYPQSGGLAILKEGLDTIAGAAGVKWIAEQCRRTDSGRDARYYTYRMYGEYLGLDGNVQSILAHKEIDLRPGSDMVEAMVEMCTAKAWREANQAKEQITEAEAKRRGREAAENQLRGMRTHGLRMAETKASNAAIRRLGVKQKYEAHDLDKPFVVARLTWTGQSEDPAIRRMFAAGTMQRFLGATAAAYGVQAAQEAGRGEGGQSVVYEVRSAPETPVDAPQGATELVEPDEPGENASVAPGAVVEDEEPPEGDEPDDGEMPRGPDVPPMEWKGKPFTVSPAKGEAAIPVWQVRDVGQILYWRDRLKRELEDGRVEVKFQAYQKAKLAALEWCLSNEVPY